MPKTQATQQEPSIEELGGVDGLRDRLSDPLVAGGLQDAVQENLPGIQLDVKGGMGAGSPAIHSAAQEGISGSGGQLPFFESIQESFGGFDISGIQSHTDSKANSATEDMGANAFATQGHVAFGAGSADKKTAAHEAAHHVHQTQGAGVQLSDGVGHIGDKWENNAERVADLAGANRPAENELASVVGPPTGLQSSLGQGVVQRDGEEDEDAVVDTDDQVGQEEAEAEAEAEAEKPKQKKPGRFSRFKKWASKKASGFASGAAAVGGAIATGAGVAWKATKGFFKGLWAKALKPFLKQLRNVFMGPFNPNTGMLRANRRKELTGGLQSRYKKLSGAGGGAVFSGLSAFFEYLGTIAELVSQLSGWISLVFGIAGIIGCVVPPLGAFLLTVSCIAKAIQYMSDIVMASANLVALAFTGCAAAWSKAHGNMDDDAALAFTDTAATQGVNVAMGALSVGIGAAAGGIMGGGAGAVAQMDPTKAGQVGANSITGGGSWIADNATAQAHGAMTGGSRAGAAAAKSGVGVLGAKYKSGKAVTGSAMPWKAIPAGYGDADEVAKEVYMRDDMGGNDAQKLAAQEAFNQKHKDAVAKAGPIVRATSVASGQASAAGNPVIATSGNVDSETGDQLQGQGDSAQGVKDMTKQIAGLTNQAIQVANVQGNKA